MGESTKENRSVVTLAGEDLFNFAIDREDIKVLVENLPKETKCKPEAVEYELQLLKIISTGWSITFFLENNPSREQLAEIFWKSAYDFSNTLSETTKIMTGQDVNYFHIIKERLDMYVSALTEIPETTQPAAVIGPAFARACGNSEDVFAIFTGSKMFIITVASVKEYLESIEMQ